MNKNDPDAQKKFQEVSEAYEVCSTGTNIVLMSILSDIGVTAVNCTSVAWGICEVSEWVRVLISGALK